MSDIKDFTISETEIQQELTELGVSAKTIGAASSPLVKGDEFTLVKTSKVGNNAENTEFVPLVFITSNGKSVGVKNFAALDFDDENAPKFGRTAEEIIKFQLWHTKAGTIFKVRKIDLGEERILPNQFDASGKPLTYVPKTIILEVLD